MQRTDPQNPIRFSIIIPAHNEEDNIGKTSSTIVDTFKAAAITDYEILIVDDNSTDGTEAVLHELEARYPEISHIKNPPPHGFGFAVRRGLNAFRGDAVCIVMADLSDAPEDIIAYYREIQRGAECVFGSRFIRGSRVHHYPVIKLVINRLANWFIKTLFRIDHNDITNAFKCYRREVIAGIQPILAHHFNLTVELPLKALVRGYRCTCIPISWTNRVTGISKLKIKEMGSRYLFIVLYVYLEKMLSKGDYIRKDRASG
ncbi:MAG: glycosyltransferase family 2 protein [bacterium]